jgi:hypothetical protein
MLGLLIATTAVIPAALLGRLSFQEKVREFILAGQDAVTRQYADSMNALRQGVPYGLSALELTTFIADRTRGRVKDQELIGYFVQDSPWALLNDSAAQPSSAEPDASAELLRSEVRGDDPDANFGLMIRNWSSEATHSQFYNVVAVDFVIVVLSFLFAYAMTRRLWLVGSFRETASLIHFGRTIGRRLWVYDGNGFSGVFSPDELSTVDLRSGWVRSFAEGGIQPADGCVVISGLEYHLVNRMRRRALLCAVQTLVRTTQMPLRLVSEVNLREHVAALVRQESLATTDASGHFELGEELAAWNTLLAGLAVRTARDTGPDLYAVQRWTALSSAERYTLLQLASEGLVNPARTSLLRDLVERGLVSYQPRSSVVSPQMLQLFRATESPQRIERWERSNSVPTLWLVQVFFVLSLVAGSAVLRSTYPSSYYLVIAMVTSAVGTIGPLIPVLQRTVGSFVAMRAPNESEERVGAPLSA